MLSYPAFDMFTQVGEISLAQDGLYLLIRGEIHSERDGFLHLYAHGENRTEQLGLFIPQGERLSLQCRISLRRMEEIQKPRFSINPLPLRPLEEPLADGFLPASALVRKEGDCRQVFIPDEAPFEEDILPFFCFLTPQITEGIPCLSMKVDGHGMPVLMH